MSIFEAIHINVNISESCSVPKYSLLIVFEYKKKKRLVANEETNLSYLIPISYILIYLQVIVPFRVITLDSLSASAYFTLSKSNVARPLE